MAQRRLVLRNVGNGHSALVSPALGSFAAGLGGLSPMGGFSEDGVASFGLSVNVGALPDEDGLSSLSPAARFTELQHKRDQLRDQAVARPDDTKLLIHLAKVYNDLCEPQGFTAFASELCATHVGAWKNVCRVLRKLERPHDAMVVLRDRHSAEPSNVEVVCALARLEPHIDWYEKALDIDPSCHEALVAIADKRRKIEHDFAEAARLYRLAYQQRQSVKNLYRLGESLIQDGHGDEGVQCLMQVLSNDDNSLDNYAIVMIVRSYTMQQSHDKVLEFFQKAQEIHTVPSAGGAHKPLMKYAWMFKGITHLNYGELILAVEALTAASQEASTPDENWSDEMIQCTLGLAETLRGNLATAEKHLAQAQQLGHGKGSVHWLDVLVNSAYLRQMQGNFEDASSSLTQVIDNSNTHAMALLRMGYLLLCQEKFQDACKYLELCLQQPARIMLTYGHNQKGMAHFYMCITLQLMEATNARTESGEKAADEHFWSGHTLLPDLARILNEHCINNSSSANSSRLVARPGNSLASGSMRLHLGSPPAIGARAQLPGPIRIAMLDLNPKQASTLLLVAERCGVVKPSVSHQASSPTGAHTFRLQTTPPALVPPNVSGSPQSLISRAPLPRTSLPAGAITSPQFPGACRRLAVGESPVSRSSAQTSPIANTPLSGLGKSSTFFVPSGTPQASGETGKPDFGYSSNSPQLLGSASSVPLMGTASTTVPTSVGPSRDASDRDLHGDCIKDKSQHPNLISSFQSLNSAMTTVDGHADEESSTDKSIFELSARMPTGKLLNFSDLELRDCISHGEYTVVHHGALQNSKLEVVVKTLHQKDCIRDHRAVTELIAEIAIIAELSHPRLVTFVGACLEPKCVALITELASGGNLHQALHVKHRKLSRSERFQLAIELLEGVCYLHARRPPIAHLDLKSMNLVLDEDGQHLKICDFGLARILDDSEAEGQMQGTDRPPSQGGSPRYMSPECYDSNLGVITVKADVWSSGCILIEIFGDTLPYSECGNIQQILKLMLVDRCGPSIPTTIELPVRNVIASTLAFNAPERVAIAEVLSQVQNIENTSRFSWRD